MFGVTWNTGTGMYSNFGLFWKRTYKVESRYDLIVLETDPAQNVPKTDQLCWYVTVTSHYNLFVFLVPDEPLVGILERLIEKSVT